MSKFREGDHVVINESCELDGSLTILIGREGVVKYKKEPGVLVVLLDGDHEDDMQDFDESELDFKSRADQPRKPRFVGNW